MSYHSLYGNLVGYKNGQLLVNGRPTGPFPASLGGNTFYVDSAVDGTDGRSPDTAFGTLDEAFAKCTANQGDVIVVMPNHAETITGAGGITHDVAGVSVIGLGTYNQRPRFLMDAGTAVTYLISAADAYVENLVFAAGHADIVTCFNVTAVGAWINNCEFVENVVNENFLTEIKATGTTDNEADGLRVTNCRVLTVDAAAVEFIELNADIHGLVVRDNVVIKSGGTASPLILQATGKDLQACDIQWNFLQHAMTANDLFIDNDTTANTGFVAHNRCRHVDVTSSHSLIDADGVGLFDNLSTSTNTASGFTHPAIDVNS